MMVGAGVSANPSKEVQEQDGAGCQSEIIVPIDGTEETSNAKQWRKQNLFLEIPSRTLNSSLSQESVQVKMPPTPTPTPKKVNFLLTPGPSDVKSSSSMAPTSGRAKSSLRNLLPKMSFNKSRHSESDFANQAIDASSPTPREKPSMSRSWSLTKIFTPRMKRTSSLPVTPIGHLYQESSSRGCPGSFGVAEAKGASHSISRSFSVPVLNQEGKLKRSDSFFRVIPSTPRAKEGDSIKSAATPMGDAGFGERYLFSSLSACLRIFVFWSSFWLLKWVPVL